MSSFDWLLWCSACSYRNDEKTRLLSNSYSSSSPTSSTSYYSFYYSIFSLSYSFYFSYSCSLSSLGSYGYCMSMRSANPWAKSLMVENTCF